MLVKSGGREGTWRKVEGGGRADRTKDVFSVVLLLCIYKNVGSTVPSSMLLTHLSRFFFCCPIFSSVSRLIPYSSSTLQIVVTRKSNTATYVLFRNWISSENKKEIVSSKIATGVYGEEIVYSCVDMVVVAAVYP